MRPRGASARAAVTGLVLLALAPPLPPAGAPPASTVSAPVSGEGNVVVNEFVPSEPAQQVHEFVELRNTSDQTVMLHGWQLIACVPPNNRRVARDFLLGDLIAPGEYLLLTHADYDDVESPPPDHFYEIEVPEDGGWLLLDPWSGYSDGLGLSSGLDCTEGGPAPRCDWAAGKAVTRDEQGKDTDDNAADFACQPRTPGR